MEELSIEPPVWRQPAAILEHYIKYNFADSIDMVYFIIFHKFCNFKSSTRGLPAKKRTINLVDGSCFTKMNK
jgi:hypothetical protein